LKFYFSHTFFNFPLESSFKKLTKADGSMFVVFVSLRIILRKL